MKLQKDNNGRHHITIPQELCKAMGWEKGDDLQFSVKDDETLTISRN